MSYFQATEILNRIKEGWPYPQHIVNQALQLTGDLNESGY